MKKILFLSFLGFLFNFSDSNAQLISTYGGIGAAGFSGDGGPATAAELSGPFFLHFDKSGNLLIPNYTSSCIRMINTSGIISTIAGNYSSGFSGDGGPATAAEFNGPSDAAVDDSGNIYIADHFNHAIRMVNTSGIISTAAGNEVGGYSGDGGQATDAELYRPIGVTIDDTGNIYITDAGNSCIRKVNTSGIIKTIAGNKIIQGFSGDGGPATAAELNWPAGIILDAAGDIIFSDWSNNCVRKINTSGIISTISGIGTVAGFNGDGGPATAAEMNNPNGLNKDAAGNLYLSDEGNNCVRELSPSGIITLIAGNTYPGFNGDGGPATDAELHASLGTAVNSAGDIFIADYSNNRIREVVHHNSEGINNLTPVSESILVYPNPVKDIIYIHVKNPLNAEEVILYSVAGQKILDNHTEGKQNMEISTSGLSNGSYFLKVLMTDGSNTLKKIEVAR